MAGQLDHDERVVWHGAPDRWGLFRATPFLIAIGLTAGLSIALSSGSGLTPGEYLWRLAGSLGADPALVVAAAALSGFRVDYRHRDRAYIRRAVLGDGDCHAQVIVAFPDDQAPGLLPMIDAVFDSIQAR